MTAVALIAQAAVRLEPILVKSAPAVLERIGARLSLSAAKSTASNILRLVKENKTSALLVLYEVFGAADDLVKKFFNEDPSVEAIIGLWSGYKVDPVPEDLSAKEAILDDEMRTISTAVSLHGGLSKLVALKKALELSPAHFDEYARRRENGRSLA